MIYLFDEIKTYFCFSQKFHFNVMDYFQVKGAFRKSDELDWIRNKNFIVEMIQWILLQKEKTIQLVGDPPAEICVQSLHYYK